MGSDIGFSRTQVARFRWEIVIPKFKFLSVAFIEVNRQTLSWVIVFDDTDANATSLEQISKTLETNLSSICRIFKRFEIWVNARLTDKRNLFENKLSTFMFMFYVFCVNVRSDTIISPLHTCRFVFLWFPSWSVWCEKTRRRRWWWWYAITTLLPLPLFGSTRQTI